MSDVKTQAVCECLMWCRAEPQFGTNHHRKCQHYQSEVESNGKKLFVTLINNFRDYCNEGDGVPEEMWDNYKRCLFFLGMNDRFFKCLKSEDSND